MRSLHVFRNRVFSYYFLASLIGVLGEGIFALASIVMLMKETSSVLAIGYMFVITMLPSVFLAPLSGVLIDRYNKATISIICNAARFLLIAVIPLLIWIGGFSINMMYVSIFFGYIAWYILVPANESMLKEILKEDEYVQGVSIAQAAWQVGLLSSALLAGALMKYVGMAETFLVAGLTYVIGGGLFLLIHRVYTAGLEQKEEPKPQWNTGQYVRDMREGFAYMAGNKKVFWFGLCACMFFPFVMGVNVLLAPYVYDIIQGDEFTIGMLDSGAGIGSLISAFICLSLAKRKELPMYLLLSILLLAVSTVVFSYSSGFMMAFLLYILIGIFMGNLKVLSKSLVFQYVEQSYVGRTMTTISMLSLTLAICASLGIGYLGQIDLVTAYQVLTVSLGVGVFCVLFGRYHVRQEAKSGYTAAAEDNSSTTTL